MLIYLLMSVKGTEKWCHCPFAAVVNPDLTKSAPGEVNFNYCCRHPEVVPKHTRVDSAGLLSHGGHLTDAVVIQNLTAACGQCQLPVASDKL